MRFRFWRLAPENKKKTLEAIGLIFAAGLIYLLTKLETGLFSFSENLSEYREFLTTLVYFSLININVLLILLLGFLIFRNVTKLIVERKRGALGARLRTKLMIALVFFALAPTALLFFISARYVTTSFDTWFSEKVQHTIEKTREAGSSVYKQDQTRLQSLARIALQRVQIEGSRELFLNEPEVLDLSKLKGFSEEYSLSAVKVVNQYGQLVWPKAEGTTYHHPEFLQRFLDDQGLSSFGAVDSEQQRDLVRGVAPIKSPTSGKLLGVIITETFFETQILRSIENILSDFAGLRPSAQLIKISYIILMIVIALLIVFAATWLGFYVSKKILGPLGQLSEAIKEVAHGNYQVQLDVASDDETGRLLEAFNRMARDLRLNQEETRNIEQMLRSSNIELERKRSYIEVVLGSIKTGVISLGPDLSLKSINKSAERLLGVSPELGDGAPLSSVFDPLWIEEFWSPILAKIRAGEPYSGQQELSKFGRDAVLVISAAPIEDEKSTAAGYVVVFEDASEQIRIQKMVAWREVARRIAHEIKNPITPIKLNAERLMRRFQGRFDGDDQKVFEVCMQGIISQVDGLRDLVNEFSKFSRLPTRNPKANSVSHILEDVGGLFKESYPHIRFDASGVCEVPFALVDKEQLSRAFLNILTNAVTAVKGEKTPEIKLRSVFLEAFSTIRVEIEDNGCGIPSPFVGKVIEPYFSTKKEGSGLGLAIVHQIVSEHGGYLRFLSEGKKGTTVIIEMPIEPKPSQG